ncbi:Flp family type IVb pilin [Helcococcus ovis]|uniref:Flp family type IVb pilin n=1 Tax=Helcococcus ovis TaxID=72026 RepID=A0A4R9C337_9FIRM|nr:Flp family type IVb pilin [Helcococcus ovis]TFF65512.1 hypothetical protein EQF93_08135 [Helcococcus ovis]TFF65664.1 hypothetical protein EQF91_05345 [Helcococcus ovis]WNZ00779.1 Flp family type IVb pilin [Helcococcus ovis]
MDAIRKDFKVTIVDTYKFITQEEKGQSMVEYGIILALIVIVGFIGLLALSGNLKSLYQEGVFTKIKNAFLGKI